jgi:hypothetical protein
MKEVTCQELCSGRILPAPLFMTALTDAEKALQAAIQAS